MSHICMVVQCAHPCSRHRNKCTGTRPIYPIISLVPMDSTGSCKSLPPQGHDQDHTGVATDWGQIKQEVQGIISAVFYPPLLPGTHLQGQGLALARQKSPLQRFPISALSLCPPGPHPGFPEPCWGLALSFYPRSLSPWDQSQHSSWMCSCLWPKLKHPFPWSRPFTSINVTQGPISFLVVSSPYISQRLSASPPKRAWLALPSHPTGQGPRTLHPGQEGMAFVISLDLSPLESAKSPCR